MGWAAHEFLYPYSGTGTKDPLQVQSDVILYVPWQEHITYTYTIHLAFQVNTVCKKNCAEQYYIANKCQGGYKHLASTVKISVIKKTTYPADLSNIHLCGFSSHFISWLIVIRVIWITIIHSIHHWFPPSIPHLFVICCEILTLKSKSQLIL